MYNISEMVWATVYKKKKKNMLQASSVNRHQPFPYCNLFEKKKNYFVPRPVWQNKFLLLQHPLIYLLALPIVNLQY